ncbi:excisionase [Variovorax sp.]|uniref:excisionase n=1 Tax=Variovorax sp. TaxID=1871043 RepID=UPI003BABB9DB
MSGRTTTDVAIVAPATQIVFARFVTIDLAAAMTGFTPGAIRTKIAKSVWLEGRQWVKRDGRVLIDMKGYEAWALGTDAER